jgi:hypothetical protein
MYADTSGFFPIDEISGGLVVQRTHLRRTSDALSQARGTVEPGSRIDAARIVSGSSASAATISAT